MAALVDTNVLVYRYDFRFPDKQRIAERFLRSGLELQMLRLPHQAIIEFVSVVTRPLRFLTGYCGILTDTKSR